MSVGTERETHPLATVGCPDCGGSGWAKPEVYDLANGDVSQQVELCDCVKRALEEQH